MSTRKIIVVSTTRTTPKVLYSEATTWGQLQDALTADFGSVGAMRAVVKETKNDLGSTEAVLPEGDFTLFLTPKQIKAGVGVDIVSVLEALKEKWVDSIDELIEEVEDGQHAGSVEGASKGSTSVSSEDEAFLAKLLSGKI